MTLPQQGNKSHVSNQLKQDVFSDDKIKFIIENMTDRYARQLREFTEGKQHSAPCICWLCLWRKFEENKPVGHPYDFLTFLAFDIIEEIEDPFQDEEIKKISVKKLTKEVIHRLPLFSPETKSILKKHAWWLFEEHFNIYYSKKRYHAPKFLKLISQLRYLRYKEWQKSKPEPIATINLNKKYRTSWDIARGVADFVYSKSNRKATQRELLRHLNKHKADLEPLKEFLTFMYGIKVKPENKSIIYFAIKKPIRYSFSTKSRCSRTKKTQDFSEKYGLE